MNYASIANDYVISTNFQEILLNSPERETIVASNYGVLTVLYIYISLSLYNLYYGNLKFIQKFRFYANFFIYSHPFSIVTFRDIYHKLIEIFKSTRYRFKDF